MGFSASTAHHGTCEKMCSKGKQKQKQKKQVIKFTLNCDHLEKDRIMDAANFQQFLHKRIKVNEKARNLRGRVVTIERSKGKITATSKVPFTKRYLKYITKNISRGIIYMIGCMY